MAKVKYFFGQLELFDVYPIPNAEFETLFPGIKGKRYDSFFRMVGRSTDGTIRPVHRAIMFKANPSLHQCDSRCMNATGKNCECSCRGRNHGCASFRCEAA